MPVVVITHEQVVVAVVVPVERRRGDAEVLVEVLPALVVVLAERHALAVAIKNVRWCCEALGASE